MKRISTHYIETKARDYVRSMINSYFDNGDALFREISERDYGIDAIIELFQNGTPTGRVAFIQLKGTQNTIVPLKAFPNKISCTVSSSNAYYALQNKIPVILIYSSIAERPCLYYARLQDVITEEHLGKMTEQDNITVHIPVSNSSVESLDELFNLIREYY